MGGGVGAHLLLINLLTFQNIILKKQGNLLSSMPSAAAAKANQMLVKAICKSMLVDYIFLILT